MNIKRTPKRPMIWTGDLPARYFQARPVDVSIEFQMEAVKMLEDLEELWRKFEGAFWKRFVPMMGKEIDAIKSQVAKWDPLYPTWKPDEQKAALQKLDGMTKAMGDRVKAQSQKYSQEAFAETMKGVDNTVAKAKVIAVVKVSWTIVAAVAKVATVIGVVTLPIEALKARKEFQAAQEAFKNDWGNLLKKAQAVQTATLGVGQAFQEFKLAGANSKLAGAAMVKLRASGKTLQEEVNSMDTYIAAARKSLIEQDKKIVEMEKSLTTGKVKADQAVQTMKAWRDARERCAGELQLAAQAKQWAAAAQAQLAGATLKDEGAFKNATRQLNGVAEKILKVDDTIDKGKTLLEAIDKLSKLVK